MVIRQIKCYQVDLPLHEGSYKWSGGNSVEVFDSTVVEIRTDEGIAGYGEICPLGAAYLPAYASGARAGIAELAPQLIGLDPTQLALINQAMDSGAVARQFARQIVEHLRAVMLIKLGDPALVDLPAEQRAVFNAQAERLELDRLTRAIKLFNQA